MKLDQNIKVENTRDLIINIIYWMKKPEKRQDQSQKKIKMNIINIKRKKVNNKTCISHQVIKKKLQIDMLIMRNTLKI
jgi:hypothetical protein